MSYGQLCSLVKDFEVEDITLRVLDDPQRYQAGYLFAGRRLTLARFIRRTVYWAFPGYIWLLWKSPGKTGSSCRVELLLAQDPAMQA